MRHLEIETDNRKLLDCMSSIMCSNYKSAVKTALTNRKYRYFLLYQKSLKLSFSCSTTQNAESQRSIEERKHAEDRPR